MFVEALGEGGVKRCQLVAAVGRADLMSSREFLQEPQLVDRLDHGSQHRSSNPEQDRSVSRNRTIGPYATGGSGVGGLSRERGVETALRWTRAHVPSAAKPAVDPPTTNPGVSLGSKRSGPEYWTPAKLRQISGLVTSSPEAVSNSALWLQDRGAISAYPTIHPNTRARPGQKMVGFERKGLSTINVAASNRKTAPKLNTVSKPISNRTKTKIQ